MTTAVAAASASGVPRLVVDAPLAHLRWDPPAASGRTATHRPAMVLLHGVGGGRGAWRTDAGNAASDIGAALALDGHVVLAVDLPGYGASRAIDPVSLPGLAGSVERLVETLHPHRIVLVGHSLGGIVAQEVLARGRVPLAGAVLIGTSPAFGRPDGAWQQQFLHERFAPLDAGEGMAGLATRLAPALVAPDSPAAVVARAAALLAAVPETTYRATVSALVGFDRRADLPRITVPVLCLAGEHDATAPPAVSQRMATAIPGGRFVALAGLGHLAPIESPAALLQAVRPWLAAIAHIA